MTILRPDRCGLVVALAVLAICAMALQASAQDRAKIAVVPDIAHIQEVQSVAFSPDGSLLLSGSSDGTVKLWDAATGRLIRTFVVNSRVPVTVGSVAFSPDGTRVLAGSSNSGGDKLTLWDAADGRLIRTFESKGNPVVSVAFSPDGKRVLSGHMIATYEDFISGKMIAQFKDDKNTLKLWDAVSGELIRTFKGQTNSVISVAFSPDGTRALSSSLDDNILKLWDAASGELIRTFEGHAQPILSVAFSPDGTHLISASLDDTLKLWDAATGQLTGTFKGHAGGAASVAFSRDGMRLVSGGFDKTIALWDVAKGQLIFRIRNAHSREVPSVAFSPDGARLLSGSWDTTLKLWDVASGQLVRTFGRYSGGVASVAFSPDRSRVLSGAADNALVLWDATNGQLIRSFKGHANVVWSVAFSPDGARALSGSWDKTLKLWDVANGQLIRTFEGHTKEVSSVAFSPDGTRVLSGSWDTSVKLWDVANGQLIRTFEGHTEKVSSVAFSPDGKRLISGGGRIVKLWDAASGQLIREFEGIISVQSVAFSPEGTRIVSGGIPYMVTDPMGNLELWDVATGLQISRIEGQFLGVSSVAFSPDGSRLLSGSRDRTLALWDAASGQLIRTLEGHWSEVRSVAFSPDGTRLLSSSRDGTIRIWSAETGEFLVSLLGSHDGKWLGMTPAGFFVSSREATEMLSVVRSLEPYAVMQFYDHLHRPDLVEEALKGDPEGKYRNAARRLNLERILDSGPAPRIELLPDRTEKGGETLRLAIRLIDEGGGIGPKVIWRVNGKTQGATTASGLGGPPQPGRYVVMEQALTVDPASKSEIEIIAYNGERLLATVPLRFAIDAWGVATHERPRMFVLAVGVDKYLKEDWKLSYAVKDATSFADALKAVGNMKVEGSPMFSNVQVTTLLDPQVTVRGLAAEFERLASIVKARDVFVLFLGGHGKSIAGDGWFYLPQDLNTDAGQRIETHGIGQAKLQAWMAKIPAQKRLVVLDACESGATDPIRGRSLDRERETVMAQLEHATGDNIISAAPEGKAAYEGYKGHGVLTYALLEALHRPEGAAEEAVSVFGIAAHISRQVPAISQSAFGLRQVPRFTPNGEDFPLGMRAAVLKDELVISSVPTHVNTELLRVFKEPGGKGGVVKQLQPFTPVTLVKSERGWAYIARNRQALGYVPEGKLKRLAGDASAEPVSIAPAAKKPARPPRPQAHPKRENGPAPSKDTDLQNSNPRY